MEVVSDKKEEEVEALTVRSLISTTKTSPVRSDEARMSSGVKERSYTCVFFAIEGFEDKPRSQVCIVEPR